MDEIEDGWAAERGPVLMGGVATLTGGSAVGAAQATEPGRPGVVDFADVRGSVRRYLAVKHELIVRESAGVRG